MTSVVFCFSGHQHRDGYQQDPRDHGGLQRRQHLRRTHGRHLVRTKGTDVQHHRLHVGATNTSDN